MTTVQSPGMTIGEAAARLGLTTHTLRYYESEQLLLGSPGRTAAGRRRYDEDDVRWIEMVQRLRATGMPVRAIRAYAELCRAGPGNEDQRLAVLEAHRDEVRRHLAEVTDHLDAINHKIAGYRTVWG